MNKVFYMVTVLKKNTLSGNKGDYRLPWKSSG